MFEEDDEKPNRESKTERTLLYIIVWLVLAWPVGGLVYDYWYTVGLFGTPESDGLLPYLIWLVFTTLFIAPYLTSKIINGLYGRQASVHLTVRQRAAELLRGTWEFFRDVSHIFRTITLAWWAALLPLGLYLAIALGGWLYVLPFLAGNVLVAYKLNKARRSRGVESFDDKNFSGISRAIDEYVDLIKRDRATKSNSG